MDYATFIRQAEQGEPPAMTLLHGGDGQLLDDALDATTRGLFPDRALAAWGREVFDGRESSADEIVRAAATMPLGVDRRLVAGRRPQALAVRRARPRSRADPTTETWASRTSARSSANSAWTTSST